MIESQNRLLSIMILTKDRKKEVIRALRSCIECNLPADTEFVIVDNASTDGTKEAITEFFIQHPFDYAYHQLPENIGCAAGRNEGLQRSRGRYIFFLDDDAYIQEPKNSFFQNMIEAMNEHLDIYCITTSIYDTKLNDYRACHPSKIDSSSHLHKAMIFHGGSSLIDKWRLLGGHKLLNDYQFRGMAELYPALKHFFKSRYIYEMKDIKTIHDPSENQFFSPKMQVIYHYVGQMHVKLIFYPWITLPIIYTMFYLRIVKHLGLRALPEAAAQLRRINKNLNKETVNLYNMYKLYREFGFSATF